MWVVIHIVSNFVYARKRMKYLHILFHVLQHVISQNIHVFHMFIFHQIGKSFLLYTCHIQNIGIGNGFCIECSMLVVNNVMLFTIKFIFLWHTQFFRCNEMECRIKMTHCRDKGMHRAPIFQVADKIDIEIF